MPHIWRKFTDGTWRQVTGIWRKFTVPDSSGNYWRPVTFVWRRNTAGVWQQVYLSEDNLSRPISGFTFTSNDVSGDFYSGSTLTLKRGTWSNTPTEYRMRIQYGLSENQTDGTVAGPVTYTPSNSNSDTQLTYTLTAYDCLEPSYYYKGTIAVDNAAGTNTVTNGNQRRGKMNISVSANALTSITSNGATASWTADVIGDLEGFGNDTYIDAINLIVYNSSFSIVKQWQYRPNGGTIESGYTSFTPTKPTSTTFSYTFSDPAITSAGGQHTLEVQVIARDTDKTFYFASRQFTPLFAKPVNVSIPTINDTTPTVGDQLIADPGTWNGQTPLTYSYQWQSSFDLNNWSNISGATSSVFYVNPTGFYEGAYLRVRVIARDPQNQDSDPAFSNATSQVAQYIPNPVRNLSAVAQAGVYILATWDRPLTDPVWGACSLYYIYVNGSYQDQLSSSNSSLAISLGPFSSGTYSVSVYAVYGDPFLASATSNPVTVSNIVLTATPQWTGTNFTYNGTFREGETVSVNATGSTYWTNSPTSYNYEWGFYSNNFGEDVIYQSGSSSSFTIPTNYADNSLNPSDLLRVKVTATNSGGSTSVYGPYQTVAQGQVPTNVSVSVSPTSGTAGTTQFTASPSSTNGTSYTYQWRYYDGSFGLSGWAAISGATSQTYTPPANYVSIYGSGLRVSVIASNVFGSSSEVLSTSTTTVNAAATAPSNISIPTLSPTSLSVGTTLTAGIGSWSGTTPITYDLRIYRGTANVATFETLVANTTTTSSSTTLTYTITQADYDSGQRYFRTFVNATNSAGSSGFVAGQERGPVAAPSGSAPLPPTNLSITYNGWNGSQHSWTASWSASSGATTYEAYREVAENYGGPVTGTSTPQTGLTSTSTTFTASNQANDWARFYVRARNSFGVSAYAGPSDWA